MHIRELIGKKVTNIYQIVEYEFYGLDKGECFIELDNNLVIDIPYDYDDIDQEVNFKELSGENESLFKDLSDIPFYHLDEDGNPILETKKEVTVLTFSFWQRVGNFLLYGEKPVARKEIVKETQSYKADIVENKCKYIKDRIITDVLFFNKNEKAFIELDNGYIISETTYSNNGTGRVGLNIYDNLAILTKWQGNEFVRTSAQ